VYGVVALCRFCLFQQSEHGSENIVYLMQSVIVEFYFEQSDQDRNVNIV
jgi:hypothetical protein